MQSVRMTKGEERQIELKCRQINKILINNDHPPMQESELVHLLIKLALPMIDVDNNAIFTLED